MNQSSKPISNKLLNQLPNQLYINGQWQNSSSNQTFDVINPATEEIITQVQSAEIKDVHLALDAAEVAMKKWQEVSPRDKGEILRKAYELMLENDEYIASLITKENGKAYIDAIGEARYSAEFFRWFSEEAVRIDGIYTTAPISKTKTIIQHKPAGIVCMVTPWNYPAAMATRKIAPALAAGCSMVIKPAEDTPLTMLALMNILEMAGVPKGMVNVLPTIEPKKIVDEILHDSRVRVVSFTGSTNTGKSILKVASEQVINPAMELGGNAPFIVFDDADLDKAVEGLMIAKMRNIGEACTAANRIYVHQKIHDQFIDKFISKMKSLKVGDGVDKNNDIGALANKATLEKVEIFVKDAINKGAKCLLGGEKLKGRGYFYPPTVITDVPDNASCLDDEIFGPVAMIQQFNNQEELIQKANNTRYGLVAYLYTKDLMRGMKVSSALEFGMVGLNRGLVSDPATPFGGVKQSGLGREGGYEGIYEFTETQYISVDW